MKPEKVTSGCAPGLLNSGYLMHADLEHLIELQDVDAAIARLNAEIATFPKRVAAIETKLNRAKAQVEQVKAATKAGEQAKRGYESEIQTQQQKISKYKDQSLNVKTNAEYKALLQEVNFAEDAIKGLEDKILEVMMDADTKKDELKAAEAELKAETAEIEHEKEQARQVTAKDEAELKTIHARRDELRKVISPDTLQHYERVLKFRGSGIAVEKNGMCMGCRVYLRPQVIQHVHTNNEIVFCDQCQRILYSEPPAIAPPSEASA
jgi:predicted  nucleic acid-binding Zn-ribbon protein